MSSFPKKIGKVQGEKLHHMSVKVFSPNTATDHNCLLSPREQDTESQSPPETSPESHWSQYRHCKVLPLQSNGMTES